MYIPLTFEGALQKCLFASGGYEGYFISGSQQWKYHMFTGSSDLVVQKGTIDNVQIYVIGGGGAGGNRNNSIGAGGGGGGGVNYTMNGRLFGGAYAVKVGKGGDAIAAQNTNGLNGVSSSFIGSNINMVAGGGGGGIGLDASTGGTGGQPNGGNGGNGGSTSATDGAAGITIYFAESANGYGCGGGGASNLFNPGDQGFSCNGTFYGDGANGTNFADAGANRYGMGGGGGNDTSSSADGGSGSVLIQYPIYDYCNNYFNETGSCGCREITFSTTDPLNYYPDLTGSYIYMPCGGNHFISGSLIAYNDLTVCAVSNSYYSVTGFQGGSGFVNSGPECTSASLSPTTCSVEWFAPTCTSSVVTIYTPSGSVGTPTTFGYVAKNETTHSVYTSTSAKVNYICISTGSLYNGNNPYPKVLNGDFASIYNNASCNTITLVADWAGKSPSVVSQTTYYYYACNGEKTSITFSRPTSNFTGALSASFCRDMLTPTYFVRQGSSLPTEYLYTGSACLSSYFDTGSCGCP